MPERWECRYSSSEMLYLELRGAYVITYLHHSPQSPGRHSFDDVLAGKHDAMIAQLFGATAVDEVKAAIVAQRGNAPTPLTRQQLREKRREEQRREQEERNSAGWPGGTPGGKES